MSLATILSQTGTVDMSAAVSILSATHAGVPAEVRLRFDFDSLHTDAQTITLVITRGGRYYDTLTYDVIAGQTSGSKDADEISLKTGETIAITAESSNANDTAVTVTFEGVRREPLQPSVAGRDLAVDASGNVASNNMVPAPLDATATQAAAAAAITAYAPSTHSAAAVWQVVDRTLTAFGFNVELSEANLTALFSDVDVSGLIASIVQQFDEATDVPVETVATLAATKTLDALLASATFLQLFADALAAKTAGQSVDAKLTTERAAKLDRDLAHAGDAATYKADVTGLAATLAAAFPLDGSSVPVINSQSVTAIGGGIDLSGVDVGDVSIDTTALASALAILLKTTAIRNVSGLKVTDLVAIRGTTWAVPLAVTLPVGWTRIEFTARSESSDLQAASVLHLRKSNPADAGTDGLLLLGGSETTAANGEIDVTGDVPIVKLAAVASSLVAVEQFAYDAKVWVGTTITQETRGTLSVERDVTRSVD